MIIETCPECGSALQHLEYATYPPIAAWYCEKCGWRYEQREKVITVPFQKPDDGVCGFLPMTQNYGTGGQPLEQ